MDTMVIIQLVITISGFVGVIATLKANNINSERRIDELKEDMTKKFEKYNGLKEFMFGNAKNIAVIERDLKTLWHKFDDMCHENKNNH